MKAHLSTLALLAGCLLSIATSGTSVWGDSVTVEGDDFMLEPGETAFVTVRVGATTGTFHAATVQAGVQWHDGGPIEVTVTGTELSSTTSVKTVPADGTPPFFGTILDDAFAACVAFDAADVCWIELDVEVTAVGDTPALGAFHGLISAHITSGNELGPSPDHHLEIELVPFE